MRIHLSICLSELDHPHVEIEPPDADDEQPWVRVVLSETVNIAGSERDVRRWVEELTVKLAML